MQNHCDIVKWDESDHQFKWEGVGAIHVLGTHESLKIKKNRTLASYWLLQSFVGIDVQIAHGYCTKNVHRSAQNSAASQVFIVLILKL